MKNFEDIDFRSYYMDIEDKSEQFHEDLDHYGEQCCDFKDHFEISWIYHENALDGMVLTYHEIKAAIAEQVVSDIKLVPTYHDVQNLRDAIVLIRHAAKAKRSRLNLDLIIKLHEMLSQGDHRGHPGEWRRDVPLHRSYFHTITPPETIVPMLEKLLRGASSAEFKRWHPIKQAAAFHHEFMRIFPFAKHNGKIGRLLMNYFLLRGAFLPAVIHSIDRQRYYESLKVEPTQLRALICEALANAFDSGSKYLQENATAPQRLAVGFRN